MTLPTGLCGALHHARESLCIAQVHVEHPSHRQELQGCLDTIDRIGAFSCPQWSKYNLPMLPGDAPFSMPCGWSGWDLNNHKLMHLRKGESPNCA